MMNKIFTRYLSVVITIILFLAVIRFFDRKEYNFIYNSLIIYFSYLLLLYFEYKMKFKLKNYIKILFVITVLLHNIFGQYFNLYTTTKWFDKALHVFGTFSFALLFYSILNIRGGMLCKSIIYTFIIITAIGISVGVFLENIEFIIDVVLKTENQHGLKDVNLDLIFNVIGAVCASVFGVIRKDQD